MMEQSVKSGIFNDFNWLVASEILWTDLRRIKLEAVSIRWTVSVGNFKKLSVSLEKILMIWFVSWGKLFLAKFRTNWDIKCLVFALCSIDTSLLSLLCSGTLLSDHKHLVPEEAICRHFVGVPNASSITIFVTIFLSGWFMAMSVKLSRKSRMIFFLSNSAVFPGFPRVVEKHDQQRRTTQINLIPIFGFFYQCNQTLSPICASVNSKVNQVNLKWTFY